MALEENTSPASPTCATTVTPKPKRQYDGLEFRLNKRFTNNWSGSATYLFSRLYGNYSGLASSDENGRVSPNVNRYYDNTIMSYDANGQAVPTLDLSALGTGPLTGFRIWATAVTLNGAAPSGIQTISKPIIVVLD